MSLPGAIPVRRCRVGPWVIHAGEMAPGGMDDRRWADLPPLFDSGEVIPSGRRYTATETVRLEFLSESIFLKKYRPKGRCYGLKNMFRASRALKSFYIGHLMLAKGIPTPLPLACIEERRCRLLGASFLAVPHVRGARNLLQAWPELNERERGKTMLDLGELAGRMHAAGILHGDLNWRNILISRRDGEPVYHLVDLDGASLERKPSGDRLQHDLRHFRRDLQRHQVSDEHRTRFFAGYETTCRGVTNS